ncbi:uncharacterized protein LOC117329510 isoform X2 [Pecten maximus]|uniref:uncharacterized protein LOC117329510 isoform X2 n=1 Tax=Pecten maximus TaxID=6579 RepID=UPI001457FA7E|nr:uncharacterized protein LOC117329510 isoform X2 [Pecten maximus]
MSNTQTSSQGEVPSPRRILATSTPAPASTTHNKPDVSQLFQKLGDKLGWFQYNNIDAAIETLSKSAKKKSTRSRRDKAIHKEPDDIHTLQDAECKPRRKHQKGRIRQKHDNECQSSEECKENKKPAGKKASVRSQSSRGSGEVSMDDDVQGVPVRKSAACTDLKRSQTTQNDRKKRKQKTKNTVSTSESPQIPTRGHDIRLSSVRSSSESPEYLGDYVTESTRIHSDASLECVLDSADVSAISFHRHDSLSGSTCMDSFQYNSNEDSYKLLNIKCNRSRQKVSNSTETSPTNVCLNLQSLRLDDSKHVDVKGNNSSKTVNNSGLYTTAPDPCNIEDSVEVIESSCKSEKDMTETSSGSSYEVEDVSVQVQPVSEEETGYGRHKLSSTSSGSGSSYEVEDVSVQVDPIAEQSHIIRSTSPCVMSKKDGHLKSDSSTEKIEEDSFVEVEDVSMQTSFQIPPESQPTCKTEDSCNDADSKSESFCDVMEDHSPQKQVENEKEEVPEDLHNISLPDFEFNVKPNAIFHKREPSIYFDASDISRQPMKFNRRDPSVYFDAKQSLLSSSRSSNSSCEQTQSPKDSVEPRAKGDNLKGDEEIPTCVISLSDTDSDHDQEKKSSKLFQKKHHQLHSFSSDSEDDLKSKYFPTKKTKVKSQRKYSSSTDSSSDSGIKSHLSKISHHNRLPRSVNTCTGKGSNRQRYSTEQLDNSLPDPGSDQKVSGHLSNKHWRTKQTVVEVDSSSDDEALETFFQKMKGSKKQLSSEEEEERSERMSMKEFIVDDSDVSEDEADVSEDEDDVFYISTAYKTSFHSTEDQKKISPVVFRNSSSEDEDFKTPKVSTKSSADHDFKTPISTKKKSRKLQTPGTDIWGMKEDSYLYPSNTKYSFLKSLTENLPVNKCDPEAIRFIKSFKKSKLELTQRLFKMYNETVFENKLPDDLEVIWNCRLLRTAGYCVYKKVSASGGARSVRVELSTKVCDSAERVRDTLIHELCHAAVWLVNGKTDGHGPYWRYWAKKSNQTHPEIPVIGRCHSYSISTKFTYQCSQCGYRIGRHSKSLNTDTKVCGYCHGRFTLLSNTGVSGSTPVGGGSTPRTPNKFALFVKDNYGDIKKREQNLKHKDIMKILSQEFAKSKISG